jgi:hypothetical protein
MNISSLGRQLVEQDAPHFGEAAQKILTVITDKLSVTVDK